MEPLASPGQQRRKRATTAGSSVAGRSLRDCSAGGGVCVCEGGVARGGEKGGVKSVRRGGWTCQVGHARTGRSLRCRQALKPHSHSGMPHLCQPQPIPSCLQVLEALLLVAVEVLRSSRQLALEELLGPSQLRGRPLTAGRLAQHLRSSSKDQCGWAGCCLQAAAASMTTHARKRVGMTCSSQDQATGTIPGWLRPIADLAPPP